MVFAPGVWLTVLLAAAMTIVLRNTIFGRRVFATGRHGGRGHRRLDRAQPPAHAVRSLGLAAVPVADRDGVARGERLGNGLVDLRLDLVADVVAERAAERGPGGLIDEVAINIDARRPLHLSVAGAAASVAGYADSWQESEATTD